MKTQLPPTAFTNGAAINGYRNSGAVVLCSPNGTSQHAAGIPPSKPIRRWALQPCLDEWWSSMIDRWVVRWRSTWTRNLEACVEIECHYHILPREAIFSGCCGEAFVVQQMLRLVPLLS